MRNASVAAVRFVAEVAAVLVSVCAVCAGLLWLALWLLGIVFVWLPRLFLRTAVLGAVLAAAGCATMANGAVHRADVVGDGPAAVLQVHHRDRVRPDGPAHPDGAPSPSWPSDSFPPSSKSRSIASAGSTTGTT